MDLVEITLARFAAQRAMDSGEHGSPAEAEDAATEFKWLDHVTDRLKQGSNYKFRCTDHLECDPDDE